MIRTKKQKTNQISNRRSAKPTSRQFIDHVEELKSRLFVVAVSFVFASGIAYAFFPLIEKLLVSPLGDQELYYLTPAGGLGFIIKTCMYAGLIGMLPVTVYQLYKFVMPAFEAQRPRVILLTVASTLLAAIGLAFGYFVSLPAALNFLTTIDLGGVSPLLTIDAYISFVMAYLVAGALLFQLPLFLLIVNSVTPLPPRRLMSSQGHVIIGSFIIAAIISPTPDVVNQTILAAPIIVMYQMSIVMIWLVNRRKSARQASYVKPRVPTKEEVHVVVTPKPPVPKAVTDISERSHPRHPRLRMTVDGISRLPTQPIS